jgi:hypothetical protein
MVTGDRVRSVSNKLLSFESGVRRFGRSGRPGLPGALRLRRVVAAASPPTTGPYSDLNGNDQNQRRAVPGHDLQVPSLAFETKKLSRRGDENRLRSARRSVKVGTY